MRKRLFITTSLLAGFLGLMPLLGNAQELLTPIPTPKLGGGYAADSDQPLTVVCLNPGTPSYGGTNTGVVDFVRSYDMNSVEDQLGMKLNGHIGIGWFGADAKAEFMHYMSTDDLSESLLYRTSLEFKNIQYNAPASDVLNSTGIMHLKNGPADFRQYCGDAYVAQINHGAYLYLALQFHFLSKQDKTNFDAQFKGDFASLANLTTDLSRKIDQSHIQGNIHLLALQEGGDPQYLSQIFQSQDPNQPSPYTDCSLENIDACTAVMNSAMNYISNAQTGFPSQLVLAPGEQYPANAAETGIVPTDYYAIIHEHTDSKLTPQIVSMRDKLGNYLQQTQAQAQRGEYLQTSIQHYPFVYDDFAMQLQNTIQALQTNESNLLIAGRTCFDDLDNCLVVVQNTLNQLIPIDNNTLTPPETIQLNEINNRGNTNQLYVATDNDPPVPLMPKTFLGIQTTPTITGEYDLDFEISDEQIYLTKRDHATDTVIAYYQGVVSGENTYTGTVDYTDTSIPSGTWSATVTPFTPMKREK